MSASEGVRLVPLRRAHKDVTRQWANDPEISHLMNRARQVSEAEHDAWFESILTRPDCLFFAIENGPEPRHVGNVWLWGIDERHRHAELRVMIGDGTERDRGVGSTAIDLLCRHAFDRLGLHRVYAYVLEINPRARRAFERAGFVVEGTLRDDRWVGDRFVNVFVLARLASARPASGAR